MDNSVRPEFGAYRNNTPSERGQSEHDHSGHEHSEYDQSDHDRPISIVATVSASPADSIAALRQLTSQVHCVEIRADLTGDIDPRALRHHFPGTLLYTLRSTAAGGNCDDPAHRRRERLLAASDYYDFIDLEADRDLHPAILGRIAPHRRILSWHGQATDLADLRARFAALATVDAHLYRLAPFASTQTQALLAPLLLQATRRDNVRDNVMAYGRGPAATWTRVLSARYGAPVAFGRLESDRPRGNARVPSDGELPLSRLLADYSARLLSRAERLYGIIGASTTASLAPLVHNTAYQAIRLPALFLPFSTDELRRSLDELDAGLSQLGLPLTATTIVAPHKEAALALAAEASPLARRAGAASLLVRRGSGWWADNEAAGVVATMTGCGVQISGRPIAVVGCGGAGRAAAAGLSQAGAQVTLVNRSLDGGLRAAKKLDLPYLPLRGFDPRPYSALVHATPVRDAVPFPVDDLDPATAILDLNYAATDTPLIAAARANGNLTIDGKEMLLTELSRQFHLMTGRHMPTETVRAALTPPTAPPDPHLEHNSPHARPADRRDRHHGYLDIHAHGPVRLLQSPAGQPGLDR